MKDNVFQFKLPYKPTRKQVVQWLTANVPVFPDYIPDEIAEEIGPDLFYGWRFVRASDDGQIYFANCIEPGIGEEEFWAQYVQLFDFINGPGVEMSPNNWLQSKSSS